MNDNSHSPAVAFLIDRLSESLAVHRFTLQHIPHCYPHLDANARYYIAELCALQVQTWAEAAERQHTEQAETIVKYRQSVSELVNDLDRLRDKGVVCNPAALHRAKELLW